jgi:hypothetical protein
MDEGLEGGPSYCDNLCIADPDGERGIKFGSTNCEDFPERDRSSSKFAVR